jgi:D-3-phosphoglycerate dehydrogenase
LADEHILPYEHGLDLAHWRELGAEVVSGNCETEEDLIRECRDADIVVYFGDNLPFTAKVLPEFAKCALILRTAVGYDSVDVETATKLGILVANCAGYCSEDVANHALALLLACNQQIPLRQAGVRAGRWFITDMEHPTIRFDERRIGLVGLGKIGGALARKLRPLVKEIVAWDPFVSHETAAEFGAQLVELDTLLSESDLISVHLPLNPETRGRIGKRELALMKPSAYIVNTARGPIIDQEALYEAVRDKRLAGAGLDVVEVEPPPQPLHELFLMPNVVITDHCGAGSPTARRALWQIATDNVGQLLSGIIPETTVNPGATPRTALRKRK